MILRVDEILKVTDDYDESLTVMNTFILPALIIIFIFVIIFLKGYRRTKIILSLFTLAMLLLYSTLWKLDNTELISSFLSKSSQNFVYSDVFASTNDEEFSYDWRIYNSHLAEIRYGNNSFSIRPFDETLWLRNSRGPMVYIIAEGDFYFSTLVRTRKYPDTLEFPGKGRQFGGIIVRVPSSEGKDEENLFISVGYKSNELLIEVKSANKGKSTYYNTEWLSGDAELMIQREAAVFGLYARPYGTKGSWTKVQTLYRPDLPSKLIAGIMAYSNIKNNNSEGIIAYFNDIKFRKNTE